MRSRIKRRVRRELTARVAGVLSCLLLGCVALWWLIPGLNPFRQGEPMFAGIGCSRVIELAPAYLEGHLDPPQRQQIADHLAECIHCQNAFEKMRREEPQARSLQFTPFGDLLPALSGNIEVSHQPLMPFSATMPSAHVMAIQWASRK